MATFPTPLTAKPFWRQIPADNAVASLYLEVAKVQCLEFAPALNLDPAEENPEIPANYFLAIVTQARNLFNAGVSPVQGGDFDGSGYGVITYPMDWAVKNMLRPEQAIGAIA